MKPFDQLVTPSTGNPPPQAVRRLVAGRKLYNEQRYAEAILERAPRATEMLAAPGLDASGNAWTWGGYSSAIAVSANSASTKSTEASASPMT